MKRSSPPAMCPSTRAEPGAVLIGMAGTDGRIGYLKDRLEIDRNFIDVANRLGAPERRFRFGGTCVQGACRQWNDGACGVIKRMMSHLANQAETTEAELPNCFIRSTCRWFRQEGAAACRVCPEIITDTRDPTPA